VKNKKKEKFERKRSGTEKVKKDSYIYEIPSHKIASNDIRVGTRSGCAAALRLKLIEILL
jgi:hypothetical protein